MMATAVICIGVLGLLVFGLGFAVSLTRARTETLYGAGEDPTSLMYKMNRAHGNTAEFAPMLAILMAYIGTFQPSHWIGWVMIAAVVCRVLIVFGIVTGDTLNKANPFRFIGALGTYVTGLVMAVYALMGQF